MCWEQTEVQPVALSTASISKAGLLVRFCCFRNKEKLKQGQNLKRIKNKHEIKMIQGLIGAIT